MLPILPEREAFPNEALAALLETLDTGAAVDATAIHRWQLAAEDGQWTPQEAMDAARWLNLNQTGYVKIAHVHKRIEDQRKLLKVARAFCHLHPVAADVMRAMGDRPYTLEEVERTFDDNRPLWRDRYQDVVMASRTESAWRTWAEENVDLFRAKS
jgi:hypothetical protein